MYHSNQSLNISPGNPLAFEFLENFCSNSPSGGQKAVQMPHHRSIPSDQMPPTPGKHFSSFHYAPEAADVNIVQWITLLHAKGNINWFLNTFKYRAKLVQAFAFQPVQQESGIFRFECIKVYHVTWNQQDST